MTNRPIIENHHILLRPTRSESAPQKGITAIIATSPIRITISDSFAERLILVSR